MADTIRMIIVVFFIFHAFSIYSAVGSKPCLKEYTTISSFVCKCNATYCDTVEPDTRLPIDSYYVYSTSFAGSRFNKTIRNFTKLDFDIQFSIRIDENLKKQKIIGFGGTFTDAAGMNIASLPDGAQQKLIEAYFGPNGIEYSLGRIPIASNDMSTDVYSYDFTQGDIYLSKFTIAGYDHMYKLPYIDKAVVASRRNISLFGTPWSSPGWMKTNDNMVGYGKVSPDMKKIYANYLGRFLQEYESFMFHGRMWGLTTQSSPSRGCSNTSKPVYQSMCWSAEEMKDWVVNYLKPSLIDYGYGHIKLMTMDDNRGYLPEWTVSFSTAPAKNAIDGLAVQWYDDSNTSSKLLTDAHNKLPDIFILGTEACVRGPQAVELGSWIRGENIAKSIFADLQNYVAGYTHNNLAVNMKGGPSWANNFADSPIIVDSKKGEFYKQPMFYMLGHFSKFIPPESVAIGIISDDMPLNPAVAFLRPDLSIVVNAANMKDIETDVQIVYNNKTIKFTMEALSINSFIWWTS